MNEDIDDLKEFRKSVNSMLRGAYLSDKIILDRLADRNEEWFESVSFRDKVKQLLIDLVGKDISDDEAIAEIKRLQLLDFASRSTVRYDPEEEPEICDDSNESAKKNEIERLTRCISGIASFLGLPSDAKQSDICFAIMNLKQDNKKNFQGQFQLEVIAKYLKLSEDCKPSDVFTEIIELKEELDRSKKIIARLIGE
jgi:hypothetical protein